MKYFIVIFRQNNRRCSIKIEAENEAQAKQIFKNNIKNYYRYSIHEITEIEFADVNIKM